MNIYAIGSALLLFLTGLFIYEKARRRNAEALNTNIDIKKQVNDLNKDVSKNEGLLAAEEEKRKQIEEKLKKDKDADISKDELADFFNKPSDS